MYSRDASPLAVTTGTIAVRRAHMPLHFYCYWAGEYPNIYCIYRSVDHIHICVSLPLHL